MSCSSGHTFSYTGSSAAPISKDSLSWSEMVFGGKDPQHLDGTLLSSSPQPAAQNAHSLPGHGMPTPPGSTARHKYEYHRQSHPRSKD